MSDRIEQPKKKSPLILVLKFFLSLSVLAFLIYKIDPSKTIAYLNQTNYAILFLGVAAFFISKIISAFRLNRFFRVKGLSLTEYNNVKLNFLAMFYGLFIPGIGADAYRIYWLKRYFKFEIKNGLWISLLDRLSGVVALVCLMVVFFYLDGLQHPIKSFAFLLIPFSCLLFYLLIRFFFKEYLPIVFPILLQSFIVQLLQVACTWFVMLSLGVKDHHAGYLFIFLLSSLAFIIPVFGFREAVFVFGAQWLGLDIEVTAAISVLFYVCLALTSLTGMYYFFYPEKIVSTVVEDHLR